MTSEKEKAAEKCPLFGNCKCPYFGHEDCGLCDVGAAIRFALEAERKQRNALGAAQKKEIAELQREMVKANRVCNTERAAVDAAVTAGIVFKRFDAHPSAMNSRAEKAEASLKDADANAKHFLARADKAETRIAALTKEIAELKNKLEWCESGARLR